MKMMGYPKKIKICGVCEVNKKWIKLQYKDEWGDEVGLYLPHWAWKNLGKPWIGDELVCDISNSKS